MIIGIFGQKGNGKSTVANMLLNKLNEPTCWIDIITDNIDCQIIEDGRYLNEAEAIKSKNGFNILVINPYRVDFKAEHPSEKELVEAIQYSLQWKTQHNIHKIYRYIDKFDYILVNGRSLIELKTEIETTLYDIIIKHIQEYDPSLINF